MSKTCPSHETNKTWPMVRLGDVCDEIKDRIQSSKISVGEYVTTDNMVRDRGGIVPAEYVPSDVGLVEYHKDDVLIANIRPYLKKIWLADHDGGCSSDVVVFRSNADGLSSEYLYSVLSQDVYFEYVMQKPRGTKMPRGDRDWMKEFRFPLPPLSEQKEIVARLERELAAVEKMKKVFEALAETARAEFKAELKEVFEKISRGGAETRRLGDVCDVRDGTHDTPKYVLEGVPLVTSKNLVNGAIDFANTKLISHADSEAINIRSGVDDGDILFAMIGTIGNPVLIRKDREFSIKNMALFKPIKSGLFYMEYLMQYLTKAQVDMRKSANASVQSFVSLSFLRNYLIPLPPLAEQKRIVVKLEELLPLCERLK